MNDDTMNNEETDNQTKWNRKMKDQIFSSETFVGQTSDGGLPDTVSPIEQKIKKIYKRKKIKQCIQPLKNIYDPECEDREPDIETFSPDAKCTACDGGDGGDDDVDEGDVDSEQEGFQEGARGKKKSKPSPGGVFQKGIKTIQNVLDKTFEAIFIVNTIGKKGIDVVSGELINSPPISGYKDLSGKMDKIPGETKADYKTRTAPIKEQIKNKNKDKETLSNVIYMCIIFPLCIWFTYNWYYLIIYREEDGERPNGDNRRYEIDLGNSVLNEIFQYALYPLKTFDYYIMGDKGLPETIKEHNTLHVVYKFVTLFFSIGLVYFLGLSGDIGSSTKGVPPVIYYSISFLILFYFGVSVFPKILEYLMQFGGIMTTGPLVGLFIIICMFFVMLALCFITTPLAMVLFMLFLWIHSLFGVFIYGNGRTLSQTLRQMSIHAEQSIPELDDSDPNVFKADPGRRILKSLSVFLNKHMNMLVYLGILIYSFFYAYTKLLSVPLKSAISMLLLAIIGIVSIWVGGYFLEGSKPFVPDYVGSSKVSN